MEHFSDKIRKGNQKEISDLQNKVDLLLDYNLKRTDENEYLRGKYEELKAINKQLELDKRIINDRNYHLNEYIKDLEALNERLNNEINKLLTNKGE